MLLPVFLQTPAAGQTVEEDEEQQYLDDVLREEEDVSTKAPPSETGKDNQSDVFGGSGEEEQGQGQGKDGAPISPEDAGKIQVQEDLVGDEGGGEELTQAQKHEASVYVNEALDSKLDKIAGKVPAEEAKHYLVYSPSPQARGNPAIKDYEQKLWQEKVRDYNSAQLQDQLLTDLDHDIDPASLPDRLPAGGAEKGGDGAAAEGSAQAPSTLSAETGEGLGSGGGGGSSAGASPEGTQEPAAGAAPSSKFMDFLAQAGVVPATGDSQTPGGSTSGEVQGAPKAESSGAAGGGAEKAQELAQGSSGAEAAPSGKAAGAPSGQTGKGDFPSLPIPRPDRGPADSGTAEIQAAAKEAASAGGASPGEKTGDGAGPEDPKSLAGESDSAPEEAQGLATAGGGASSNFAENFSLDREISALNAPEGGASESGETSAGAAAAGGSESVEAGTSQEGEAPGPSESVDSAAAPPAAQPAALDEQAQRSAETAAVLKWERNLQDPELAAADPLTPEEVAAIERRRERVAQDPERAARLGQRIEAKEQLLDELEKDSAEMQEELADNQDWARIVLSGGPMAESTGSDTEDGQAEAQASEVSIQTDALDRLRRENQFYAELRLQALRWQLLHDRADIFLWECANASCNLPGQEDSAPPVEEPAASSQ